MGFTHLLEFQDRGSEVLLCTTKYYCVLRSTTVYYEVLLCTTEYYFKLRSTTVYYEVLLCACLLRLQMGRPLGANGTAITQHFQAPAPENLRP